MMRILIFITSFLFFCSLYAADKRTLVFPNACLKGESIIIAAVGDVLLHYPLQQTAWTKGFEHLWRDALPFIRAADLAYANLEGPIAPGITEAGKVIANAKASNSKVYTSYPAFNYPPSLALALKNSGFDIVSNANNHALDRFAVGVDKTKKILNSVKLSSVGTRIRGTEESWYKVIDKKNFKIAWIACTEATNGISDKYHQILSCYKKQDLQKILNIIQTLRHKVDAIIVLPHWGEEYETQPNSAQVRFAHQVLEAGASAVIGSHPHVLQPLKQYTTRDGRVTLIMYSLGNFVSYQGAPKTRSTVILLLGLTKTPKGTQINGVRFVPMYMQNREGLLYLMQVPNHKKTIAYDIISRVMPMGNAWYSPSLLTNPECLKQSAMDH